MAQQTIKSLLAKTAAKAALVLALTGGSAFAQDANEIMRSLQGDPADQINDIIQMEIPVPQPGGGYVTQTIPLDYSRTIDLAVFFEFDRSDITPQAQFLLNNLGQALISPQLAGKKFFIAGHTDAKGSDYYNQALSERRALAVRNYLTYHFGIEPWRLVAVGFGEQRLANPSAPNDGINRRVEVTVIAQ